MRKRQFILTAVSIVLVGGFLWSANSAHAELISTITNPSFESPAHGDGNEVADIPDWEEVNNGTRESTHQRDPFSSETPGPTDGLQVALLRVRGTPYNVTESRIWQSLGAVAADDVGQIIEVSADMWSRDQGNDRFAAMWMHISTDVTSLSTGTALVSAGDASMTRGDGVRNFAIEYTVLNSDLNDELFLQFVLSDTTPFDASDQYYIDNVKYTIPEPSTFMLLALGFGMLCLLPLLRRLRR